MIPFEGRVGAGEEMRADAWLADRARLMTRAQVKARLVSIEVNGRKAKPSIRLKENDQVRCYFSDPEPVDALPEDIPLSVLYEDANALVVDKAQGMVVHPANGNRSGTLVNALLFRFGAGLSSMGTERPGIVHRLDKDTSGALIAAKNPETLEFLAAQFRARTARKTYVALVCGKMPDSEGTVSDRLGRDPTDRKRFAPVATGGKPSVTRWKVVRSWPGYALVLLSPKTGRTHQLRVHMKKLGCPILGDPIYGRRDSRFPEATLMLHARDLSIELPGVGRLSFRAPVPRRFRDASLALDRAFPPA